MSRFSSPLDSDISALFKIMLPRLAVTAYSLQSEYDCCKAFTECFKDQKRKIIYLCIWYSCTQKFYPSLQSERLCPLRRIKNYTFLLLLQLSQSAFPFKMTMCKISHSYYFIACPLPLSKHILHFLKQKVQKICPNLLTENVQISSACVKCIRCHKDQLIYLIHTASF